jgi:NUMOD3 motif
MFYTYLWLRYDGTPYYVGKGKASRAYDNHSHRVHAPDKERILVQEFPSEAGALAAEKFFIAYYGRLDLGTGCLRNRTDGGEGVSGGHWKLSEDWCRRQGERKKGNTVRLGQTHSPETRAKMRGPRKPYKKRRPYIFGTRHSHSPEIRQRMSESAKKRVLREGVTCLVARGKKGAAVRWHIKENLSGKLTH